MNERTPAERALTALYVVASEELPEPDRRAALAALKVLTDVSATKSARARAVRAAQPLFAVAGELLDQAADLHREAIEVPRGVPAVA